MNQPVVNYDHKTIQVRRGSTTEWRKYGTICIPAEGELCVEFFQDAAGARTGALGLKVGNGTDPYNALPYLVTNESFDMDSRISNEDIQDWNEAHSWGNHADAGYLTQELDPVFTKSPAATITIADIAKWNDASSSGGMTDEERAKLEAAYGWGDHSQAGYLDSNAVIFGGTYN